MCLSLALQIVLSDIDDCSNYAITVQNKLVYLKCVEGGKSLVYVIISETSNYPFMCTRLAKDSFRFSKVCKITSL